MAIVSGTPNFVLGTSSLVGADLDNALGAVIKQVGGIYYNSGVAIIAPSNIEAVNIASSPGFSNTQKQEPASRICLTGAPGIPAVFNDSMLPADVNAPWGYPTWFPAVPVAMTVYAVSFCYASATGTGTPAPGAAVELFLNCRSAGTVLTIPEIGLQAGVLLKADVSISLAPDDIVALHVPTTFISGAGGGANYISGAQFGLWCRIPHAAGA